MSGDWYCDQCKKLIKERLVQSMIVEGTFCSDACVDVAEKEDSN